MYDVRTKHSSVYVSLMKSNERSSLPNFLHVLFSQHSHISYMSYLKAFIKEILRTSLYYTRYRGLFNLTVGQEETTKVITRYQGFNSR